MAFAMILIVVIVGLIRLVSWPFRALGRLFRAR